MTSSNDLIGGACLPWKHAIVGIEEVEETCRVVSDETHMNGGQTLRVNAKPPLIDLTVT